MWLERIEIERAEGLPDGVRLEGLGPGLNLVLGPNASGKSSLVRAAQAFFWPKAHADRWGQEVRAAFRWHHADRAGDGRLARGRAEWGGRAPNLPMWQESWRYRLDLMGFFRHQGQQDALVQYLARELAGGYDLPAVGAQFSRQQVAGTRVAAFRQADEKWQEAQRSVEALENKRRALEGVMGQDLAALERAYQRAVARHAVALAGEARREAEAALTEKHRLSLRLTGEELAVLEGVHAEEAQLEQGLRALEVELGALEERDAGPGEEALEALAVALGAWQEAERALLAVLSDKEDAQAVLESLRAQIFLPGAESAGFDGGGGDVGMGGAKEAAITPETLQGLEELGLKRQEDKARQEALAQLEGWLDALLREGEDPRALRREWWRLLSHEGLRGGGVAVGAGVALLVLGQQLWSQLGDGAYGTVGVGMIGFSLGPLAWGVWRMWARWRLGLKGAAGSPEERAEARQAAEGRWVEAEAQAYLARYREQLGVERRRLDALSQEAQRRLEEALEPLGFGGGWYGLGAQRQARFLYEYGLRRAEMAQLLVAQERHGRLHDEKQAAYEILCQQVGLPLPLDAGDAAEQLRELQRSRRAGELLRRERQILRERERELGARRAALEEKKRAFWARLDGIEGMAELYRLIPLRAEAVRRREALAEAEAGFRRAYGEAQELGWVQGEVEAGGQGVEAAVAAREAAQLALAGAREARERWLELSGEMRAQAQSRPLEEAQAERRGKLQILQEDRDKVVRDRLARWLLTRAEAAHQAQAQPEVLVRASRWFATFTQGAYQLLLRGGELWVGVVAQGTEVPISALSDGTQVQLYLALRLAALEASERGGVRVPLFLDEILATTDGARFEAIAEVVLALVKEGRQVFYFSSQAEEAARWEEVVLKQGLRHEGVDLRWHQLAGSGASG